MSSISAGTTTGTALVSTGDTTGQLVLKTNGTTTAVTIGTDQVVTLVQALPAGSGGTGLTAPGTNGNVLTSNGTIWTSSAAPSPAALSTASGSAPSYSARAWVNFNGTGTPAIRASGNVSSITDNGVGIYTINFTTAMPDADYSIVLTGNSDSNTSVIVRDSGTAQTTTSARIICFWPNIDLGDSTQVNMAVFR